MVSPGRLMSCGGTSPRKDTKKTRRIETRLAALEAQIAVRRVPGLSDDELAEQLATLDQQTRAAVETLGAVDFVRWVGGMVWYAAQP